MTVLQLVVPVTGSQLHLLEECLRSIKSNTPVDHVVNVAVGRAHIEDKVGEVVAVARGVYERTGLIITCVSPDLGYNGMVMEVLKIKYIPRHINSAADAWAGIATSRPPSGKPAPSQGYWVDLVKLQTDQIVEVDVTDGAGHGMLLAADKVFTFLYEATGKSGAGVDVWISYRWKNVSLTEYIGIVQASQL